MLCQQIVMLSGGTLSCFFKGPGAIEGWGWVLYNGRKVPNYLFSLDKDLTNAFYS